MHVSLNKILIGIIIIVLLAAYYTSRPTRASNTVINDPNASDAVICAGLPEDPATLPYVSYNTQEGFDECVTRCITSAMMQVCRQLPANSNVFATQPKVKQQMSEGCTEHIHGFVTHNTRCPYLNCEP